MDRRPVTICRIQSRICVGGPAKHTILLSSRLDRQRFRTVLVGGALEPGERDLADEARRQQVEVVTLKRMRRRPSPIGDVLSLIELVRIMRRERPAIVHTHTAKAGALGRIAARLVGVPIIVHTFHGHVFDGYFHPLMARLLVLIERWLARITDVVIVLSPTQKRDICERYAIAPPAKVRCIPLGLDLERFAAAAGETGCLRAELGLAADTIVIGTVGRLVPVKNQALFLQAARLLCDRRPDWPLAFVIVGDGELRPALEAQASALGLEERVRFLGWRHDLPQIYADLDLLTLSSLNEGTPASVIEALAAGVPVVSTAAGGVEDVLASYPLGAVVSSMQPAEMAAAAERMLRASRGRPRAPHAVGSWSAERLVRDVRELYEDRLRAA